MRVYGSVAPEAAAVPLRPSSGWAVSGDGGSLLPRLRIGIAEKGDMAARATSQSRTAGLSSTIHA